MTINNAVTLTFLKYTLPFLLIFSSGCTKIYKQASGEEAASVTFEKGSLNGVSEWRMDIDSYECKVPNGQHFLGEIGALMWPKGPLSSTIKVPGNKTFLFSISNYVSDSSSSFRKGAYQLMYMSLFTETGEQYRVFLDINVAPLDTLTSHATVEPKAQKLNKTTNEWESTRINRHKVTGGIMGSVEGWPPCK